jgi:hypothetical protein
MRYFRVRHPTVAGSLAVAIASTPTYAEPLRDEDASAEAVRWNADWQRFRAWEYAATTVVLTEAFLMRFAGPDPPHDRSQVGVDVDITDAVALSEPSREVAKLVNDIGFYGSMAYRLVDSAVLPSVVWGAPGAAWQMSWIDLEAFAVVAGVLWNVQLVVGRERPAYRYCPESADAGFDCDNGGSEHFRSFIAGHLAVATAACITLTCRFTEADSVTTWLAAR